jgi:hypothetical protein
MPLSWPFIKFPTYVLITAKGNKFELHNYDDSKKPLHLHFKVEMWRHTIQILSRQRVSDYKEQLRCLVRIASCILPIKRTVLSIGVLMTSTGDTSIWISNIKHACLNGYML